MRVLTSSVQLTRGWLLRGQLLGKHAALSSRAKSTLDGAPVLGTTVDPQSEGFKVRYVILEAVVLTGLTGCSCFAGELRPDEEACW